MLNQTNKFFNTLPSIRQRMAEEVGEIIDTTIRVSVPAEVTDVSEYTTKQHVDVQVLIGFTKPDGTTVSAPQIKKVFVKLPVGGGFRETYPIKKGNLVTLHWTHRSLNEFLDNGATEVFPDQEDRWELRDCYATVGFGTRNNNSSPDANNYTFKGDNYSKVITPSGDVTISAKDVNNSANTFNYTASTSYTITSPETSVNASSTHTVTSPQSLFNGDVGINGLLQITSMTGYGGASTVSSDVNLQATELHADNGYNGTIGANQAFQVVDGIIVGLA